MRYLLFFTLSLLILACKSTAPIVELPVEVEERFLDTMTVSAPKIVKEPVYEKAIYRSSYERNVDLIHTRLDLRFDWENQWVIGNAQLTLSPLFYPVKEFILDAKGFEIKQIKNLNDAANIQYAYDGKNILVQLEREYKKKEEIKISIDYIAKPVGEENTQGAISSDQGLFFIDPLDADPEKPTQIWTQGETENNSRWFPTIDKPIERCTQETIITVSDHFKTLSNGTLVSSTKNPDGTRTDYWHMDQPHAPYLFMLAIGDFAVVEEKWNDVLLQYYVEPEYEAYAKDIFAHTPEMLSFFSEYTGMDYPWDKYAQVVVRDYVSGAMENTTGVIFGEFVQRTKRELIDEPNDYIVAHELFHHWFGDYVTCESWANLTMNEGFANYSEYLWNEYKYGKLEADMLRQNELRGYLRSTQYGGTHDLINFEYNHRDEMFDGHSYNKGGLVLHMLRNYLGDEAFRAGLKLFLKDNAYSAVEAHHLRLAMEEVSGKDLNWFFNQWYFDKGHPELEINHHYEDGIYHLNIQQVQDPDQHAAVFELPIKLNIYLNDGQVKEKNILIDERQEHFKFSFSEKPALINVDAENILLGTKSEDLSSEEWKYQFYHCEDFQDLFDAMDALQDLPEAQDVMLDALDHPFWGIRRLGVQMLNPDHPGAEEKLVELAMNDSKSIVRTAAIYALTTIAKEHYRDIVLENVKDDKAYPTVAASIRLQYEIDPEEGLRLANQFSNEKNYDLVEVLGDLYSYSNDPVYDDFFKSKILELKGFNAYPVFSSYQMYLKNFELEQIGKGIEFLKSVGIEESSEFKRFMATNMINEFKLDAEYQLNESENDLEKTMMSSLLEICKNALTEIVEREQNPNLLERYKTF